MNEEILMLQAEIANLRERNVKLEAENQTDWLTSQQAWKDFSKTQDVQIKCRQELLRAAQRAASFLNALMPNLSNDNVTVISKQLDAAIQAVLEVEKL